jgi:hypothetical protein
VVNLIYDRRELCQLCRTCRLFRTIAEPKLYSDYFAQSKWFEKANIRQVIGHSRLETILNTITLQLPSWKYCDQHKRKRKRPSFLELREDTCSCDTVDELVGRSVRSLLNLKVLRLECQLCWVDSHERHGWICTLKTRVLKEMNFTCYCSQFDENTTKNAFSAPYMSSVTTLGWHPRRSMALKEDILESLLKRDDILPHLRYLDHQSSELDNLLLRYKPIIRLSGLFDLAGRLDYESLKNKSKRITHLNVSFFRSSSHGLAFFDTIAKDIGFFRNLQYIGSFPLTSRSFSVSYRHLTGSFIELTTL